MTENNHKPLIEVKNLVKYYPVLGGILRRPVAWIKAVDNVSFSIGKGETLSLVGETGCGKSTVGLAILSLIPHNSGCVVFEGVDLFGLDRNSLKQYRRDMQIVFQDPFSSLDPRLPVGESIAEGLVIHGIGTEKERFERVLETMKKVGLEDYHAMRYPHEFSGGQRQRIGIARALIMQPKFIMLDEPVSALDVSVQAQILNILKDLQQEFDLTYLFVAHNLAVVEHISDQVAVMYLGKIIEKAQRAELFGRPMHPYTKALISAIPAAHPKLKKERIILKGDVPSALNPPKGCNFHPRCPVARADCAEIEPSLDELYPDHFVACRYAG
jgi:oligopeptide/dipeptide ABC transporter ATP-binding protein